jgi:hypothetical protein
MRSFWRSWPTLRSSRGTTARTFGSPGSTCPGTRGVTHLKWHDQASRALLEDSAHEGVQLQDCTSRWTFRGWLHATREGRRTGMDKIFASIKAFIENSPRTQRSRGTTFHATLTYFWVHMVRPTTDTDEPLALDERVRCSIGPDDGWLLDDQVHYAMTVTNNPTGLFKGFLLMNPQLSNGGMFLHFYTKKHSTW